MAARKEANRTDEAKDAKTAKPLEEMTFDEVKQDQKILADLPDIQKPETFTPKVAAECMQTRARIREVFRQIQESTAENAKDSAYALAVGTADILNTADEFLRSISLDANAYDAWSRGRNPDALAYAYATLVFWLEAQLGK
ncbi:MAG: hypothetical protein SOI13_01635 [Bifidobacterium mongoliense]|uniref:hypothetical protein n=1 Tax=Bifidobacterium mongoliense TaxID=518643 RepID=UPI002F350E25